MPDARLATAGDLDSLLELFAQGEVSDSATPFEKARGIWASTLRQGGLFVFVCEAESRIVATCMLITAPNLLRGGQKHGFLENVVTHPDHRRHGYGRAVVRAALETAWIEDCYHVMLQSGRSDPGVHRFYEDCGFAGGLRTAYVARRSSGG